MRSGTTDPAAAFTLIAEPGRIDSEGLAGTQTESVPLTPGIQQADYRMRPNLREESGSLSPIPYTAPGYDRPNGPPAVFTAPWDDNEITSYDIPGDVPLWNRMQRGAGITRSAFSEDNARQVAWERGNE